MEHPKARVLSSSAIVSCQPGKAAATLAPGDGHRPPSDQGLALTFRFDRDPPTKVRVSSGKQGLEGQQVRPGVWWFALAGPEDVGPWQVTWKAPAVGGALVKAVFCRRRDLGEASYDLIQAYRDVLARHGQRWSGQRDLRPWFLKMDLATATAEIQAERLHEPVAHELGIDPALLRALRAGPVDALRQFLFERWRLRAVACAATLECRHVLPWTVAHQRTAEQVLALLLTLLRREFGEQLDRSWMWDQVLAFGAGALRLPVGSDRYNCEPNSVAFACFAELFDLGCDPRTALEGQDLEDCRDLRMMFVSALEAFFDSYVAPEARPRRIALYGHPNLSAGARPGEQRWTADGRRRGVIREYRKRCRIDEHPRGRRLGGEERRRADEAFEAGEAWLRERWGDVLERGLADEPAVAAVRHGRR